MKLASAFLISIVSHAAVLALPISHYDTPVEQVMPVTLLRLARDTGIEPVKPAAPRTGMKSRERRRPAGPDIPDNRRETNHSLEVAANVPTREAATHETEERQIIAARLEEAPGEQPSRISLRSGAENGAAKDAGAGNPDGGIGFGGNGTQGGDASNWTVTHVDYAHNPKPPYPERAQREGWEGRVLLRVLVNEEGKPQSIEISQSSGFETLDLAAVKTVHQWRFHPARYGEKEIKSWVRVPIVFKLTELRD